MKLNIGDRVVMKVSGFKVRATVEDASKGDEIQAKVESVEPEGSSHQYETGKVYLFKRNDIEA